MHISANPMEVIQISGGANNIFQNKKRSTISQKKKIPASDLSVKPGDSAAVKKKKVFAKNARSWNHMGSTSKLMGG